MLKPKKNNYKKLNKTFFNHVNNITTQKRQS